MTFWRFLHLVSPVVGFVVIAYVLVNADSNAKIGGLVWLAVGVLALLYFRRTAGIRAEHAATTTERVDV